MDGLHVLGPLEVVVEGVSRPLGGRRRRRLLSVLALWANTVVSNDRLVDVVWGADAERSVLGALRTEISRVRQSLKGLASVVAEGGGYRLEIDRDQLDVTRFEGLIAAAVSLDGADVVGMYGHALGLWRGDPFAEIADSVEAAAAEGQRLQGLWVSAVVRRAEAQLVLAGDDAGDLGEVAGQLRGLVEEHPLQERLWALLMLSLYRSGRQAEALAAFQQARGVLVEGLGLEPSQELILLEQQILEHDLALDAAVQESSQVQSGVRDTEAAGRPSGTVTFLFTDIEGSTALWELHPVEMRTALEVHDEILRGEIEARGGYVFSAAGDAFAAAFARAGDALATAQSAQEALAVESWPTPTPIQVRMGLHTGEAQERDGDYFGPALNRAARIMAAGHGGQVLVSSTTAGVAGPNGLADLGAHRLKDLSARERIFQIGEQSFPVLRSLDAVRQNLPVERTPLVGRDDEIDQIAELVAEHRLVTLLGIGGTGKTRLATAVAAEIVDQFSDGVWFVDLVPASGPEHVVEAIAMSAGLSVFGTDPLAALAALMSEREMLVVLDNCEHLTEDVAEVTDVLLEQTASPRFLATSREPLQLLDERQVHVAPLAIGDDLSSPAIALFVAAAERVDVHIGADDVHVVRSVCAQLDGLPLAIELAAAQLRQYSLAELAVRLDHRFEVLARRVGRPWRQASLQAVLKDTWAMLDKQEQELLMLLAAFPSCFAADDVEAAVGGAEIGPVGLTLAGLVDRSLVTRDGEGRHRLLETVKLFARDKWPEEDRDRYLEQHTQWVLDHLSSYSPQDWYTSAVLATWAHSHYEDHRLTEDRLAAANRLGELTALLGALTGLSGWQQGFRASATIDRIELYLEQLQTDAQQKAVLNLNAAAAGLASRRVDWITKGSDQAERLFRKSSRPEQLAWALITTTWTRSFQDLEGALTLLDEAEVIADEAGAQVIADIAVAHRANLLALAGQIDEAVAYLEDLRLRIEDRPFDFAWNEYLSLSSALQLVPNPEAARASAAALRVENAGVFGRQALPYTFHVLAAQTVAACGDVEQTQLELARAEQAVRDGESRDGLPDLLIPPAALAWALSREDLSRAWLTAVRHAPRPPHNFLFVLSYRQLRDQVGLLEGNPLDHTTIERVYQEATDWLASLNLTT